LLKRSFDPRKDQTYFLYRLTQKQLSEVMFPLGTLKKEEARKLCLEHGFFTEDKDESQDFYSGEYSDLFKPNRAGETSRSPWEVLGPMRVLELFDGQRAVWK
jgi:tRNA-specific 2-thiouridylase